MNTNSLAKMNAFSLSPSSVVVSDINQVKQIIDLLAQFTTAETRGSRADDDLRDLSRGHGGSLFQLMLYGSDKATAIMPALYGGDRVAGALRGASLPDLVCRVAVHSQDGHDWTLLVPKSTSMGALLDALAEAISERMAADIRSVRLLISGEPIFRDQTVDACADDDGPLQIDSFLEQSGGAGRTGREIFADLVEFEEQASRERIEWERHRIVLDDELSSSTGSGTGDESVPSAGSGTGDESSASDESVPSDEASSIAGSGTGGESGAGDESLSSAGSSARSGSTTGDELSLRDASGAGEETGRVAELEAQLDASDETRNRLVDRLEEELEAQLEDFNKRALELEGANADLSGQVVELEAQRDASDARALELEVANADLRGQVAELEAHREASDTRALELEGNNTALTDKLEASKADDSFVMDMLKVSEAKVSRLRAENSDLRRSLEAAPPRDFEHEYNELVREHNETKAVLEQEYERNKALQKDNEAKERELIEAREDKAKLERQLTEARQTTAAATDENEDKDRQIAKLVQELALKNTQIAKLQGEKDASDQKITELEQEKDEQPKEQEKASAQEIAKEAELTKDSYFMQSKTLLEDEDYIAMVELLCGDLVRVGGQKDQTEAAMNVIAHTVAKQWHRTKGKLPIRSIIKACISALEGRFPGLKGEAGTIRSKVSDLTRTGTRKEVNDAMVVTLPPDITPVNVHAEGPEGASCVNGDDLCVSKQNGQKPQFKDMELKTKGSNHQVKWVVCKECEDQKRAPENDPKFGDDSCWY